MFSNIVNIDNTNNIDRIREVWGNNYETLIEPISFRMEYINLSRHLLAGTYKWDSDTCELANSQTPGDRPQLYW